MQRQIALLTKENQRKQDLIGQQQRREEQYREDYYERFGKSPPESEDEDEGNEGVDELDDVLDSSGSDEGDMFPSSVRALNTITNSPARIKPRKTTVRPHVAPVPARDTLSPRQSEPQPQPSQQSDAHPSTVPKAKAQATEPKGTQPTPNNGTDKNPDTAVERPPELRPGTRGKNLEDYCGLGKSILRRCLHDYECSVIGYYMFPDPDEHNDICTKIWRFRNDELVPDGELPFTLTEEARRLLGKRATRVRSASRDRVEALIAPMFGFKKKVHKAKNVRYNQRKYNLLATEFGWYYKNPKERTGYMKHPIIAEAMCKVLYYNKRAYGTRTEWDKAFRPISKGTMAFIFTLIDHCLGKWSSGRHVGHEMNEDDLLTVYQRHLTRIEEWLELDEEQTELVRKRWSDQGLAYAQVLQQDNERAPMSKKDRENALRELQEDSSDSNDSADESDSESDSDSQAGADEVRRQDATPQASHSILAGTTDAHEAVENAYGSEDSGDEVESRKTDSKGGSRRRR
ncbi:hypothetical protein PM082_019522 [Marasmius tenuissimus]|nr:hypothetical protein PM082_019522 [Marasmius tenuissimus]